MQNSNIQPNIPAPQNVQWQPEVHQPAFYEDEWYPQRIRAYAVADPIASRLIPHWGLGTVRSYYRDDYAVVINVHLTDHGPVSVLTREPGIFHATAPLSLDALVRLKTLVQQDARLHNQLGIMHNPFWVLKTDDLPGRSGEIVRLCHEWTVDVLQIEGILIAVPQHHVPHPAHMIRTLSGHVFSDGDTESLQLDDAHVFTHTLRP